MLYIKNNNQNNNIMNNKKPENKIFKKKSEINIPWGQLKPFAYAIAQDLLGVEPSGDITSISCPGKELHTNPDGEEHTWLYLDGGAPVINCMHESCRGINDDAQAKLRSRIGYMKTALHVLNEADGEETPEYGRLLSAAFSGIYIPNKNIKYTPVEKRKRAQNKEDISARILPLVEKDVEEFKLSSTIDNPQYLQADEQTKLHLSLFKNCTGNVWVGEAYSSGDKFMLNFQPYDFYKDNGSKGHFTCGSTFKAWSRSNAGVKENPYIVMECDEYKKTYKDTGPGWQDKCIELGLELVKRVCSTYKLDPVLVLDSGNGSVHAWFIREEVEKVLNIKSDTKANIKTAGLVFEALKMDAAMVKRSQPGRLAGKMRGVRLQSLLYINELKIYGNKKDKE